MNAIGIMKIILPALFLASAVIPAAAENTVPKEVSGFRLGASIEEYSFIKNRNYLTEVVIDNIGGFRRGEIAYGTCAHPDEIVHIKLKYKDTTRQYFDELLKRYKDKFGKPDEYTGDAFGIVISWKWRFRDKEGNYISMTLQYNQKNLDETIGSMVKLSMPDRIEEERKCFLEACEKEKANCPIHMMSEEWENLIPK